MEQELAFKLQKDRIFYQTQVEIPVTTADFYFPTQPRPLIVFVDGQVHLGKAQAVKDEELRTLLRKKGYRILELSYNNYSDKSETIFIAKSWPPSAGKSFEVEYSKGRPTSFENRVSRRVA